VNAQGDIPFPLSISNPNSTIVSENIDISNLPNHHFQIPLVNIAPLSSTTTDTQASPASYPANSAPTHVANSVAVPVAISTAPTLDSAAATPLPISISDQPIHPPSYAMITRSKTNSFRSKSFSNYKLFHTTTLKTEPTSYSRAATNSNGEPPCNSNMMP
jgi:hypothetical protein